MPVYGMPDKVTNPTFEKDTFKLLIPKFKVFVDGEEGEQIYEIFKDIANDQIYSNIWGKKWNYAMCLAIAHYLDMNNYDRESSYSLNESKKDSGPKGFRVSETTEDKETVSYSLEDVTVAKSYTKFWNATEYGRRLITMLQSVGVPTIIVVN
ncbi:hypothetical protein DRO61_00895 [Candidatus Bathyarchaeota archaeon]|nr:MAG: hypothetical protein DRO61_00895 [Candidatus Bathyarchaeota archaeon]